jgi:aconitate hydratase
MSSTLRASKDTLQAKIKPGITTACRWLPKNWAIISRLPKSLKVLLENLLRWQDGDSVTAEDIHALAGWLNMPMPTGKSPTVRRAS